MRQNTTIQEKQQRHALLALFAAAVERRDGMVAGDSYVDKS